jgi:hypothetical protein
VELSREPEMACLEISSKLADYSDYAYCMFYT